MNTPARPLETPLIAAPELVDQVLRDRQFAVIDLKTHIEKLAQATGEDFTPLLEFVDHTLIYQNNASHLEKRRLIAGALSDKAVAQWKPMIVAKTQAMLDRIEGREDIDLVKDLIDPLFCDIIAELIGFAPHPDRAREMVEMVTLTSRFVERFVSLKKIRRINEYLSDRDLLSHYTETVPPGAPVPLSVHLSRQLDDTPQKQSIIRNTSMALLIAAHSVASGLSFSCWGLLMRGGPTWVQAGHDGWLDRNIESTLNAYLSSRTLGRVATKDVDIGGCPMHLNQPLVLDLTASNQSLRQNWLNDGSDPSKRGPSFAFGAGHHKCPGEAFARAFISIALPAISQRFPNMVLHRDQAKFMVTSLMHAPTSLPCTLAPTSHKPAARLWDIRDHDTARKIVTDDIQFDPPQMEGHLRALQSRSGHDLGPVIRIAKNAMFFMSGPRHADARFAVANVLGQNRLRQWHGLIDARIQANLAGLENAAQPDLIRDFANPVFQEITKPILGLIPSDLARFDAIAPTLQDVLEPLLPLRQILHLQDTFAELLALIDTGEQPPSDGPLSLRQSLLNNPPPDFDSADISALVLVLYGASFNLSHTLGNALHWILSLPLEMRQNLADPNWCKTHLEQIISTCASPKFIYRHAKNACPIDGLNIDAGDTTRIHLNAVNNHKTTGHLAFGHGLHHCVGASLSRALLRSAIPAVFSHFRGLRLVSQGHTYFEMSQTVAMKTLPCTWDETS